jgi:hypothetical protein
MIIEWSFERNAPPFRGSAVRNYNLIALDDTALLRRLSSLVARDRVNTATLLAHIAEVDARRLYLPLGYASMHAYCTEALHLSDDAAYKRIQAARAARQFPLLLDAVARGRLHLTAVCLLAPHLCEDNVDLLIDLATHGRRLEIERTLTELFAPGWPPGDPGPAISSPPLALGQVDPAGLERPIAPALVSPELAPGQVDAAAPAAAFAPVKTLKLTLSLATYDKLRHAQALLAHAVPSGDPAEVFERALDALIAQLERRKFAHTPRPRSTRPEQAKPAAPRTVPAPVRRAVHRRDEGRCAFVGRDGHRCSARRRLEFDHVVPLARGGRATPDGMRLLCRAHNRYEAERVFGVNFVRRRQEEAVQERARRTCPGASARGPKSAGP